MNSTVCQDLLWHLKDSEGIVLGKCSSQERSWLSELGLPTGLRNLLFHDWPTETSYIAHLGVNPVSDMHKSEFMPILLPHKVLEIGSAPNGDLLVVRFQNDLCEVGYISGTQFWDHEERPLEVYQPIARTLASLLHRAVEGRYIPTDYDFAYAFNDFLREERNAEQDEDTNPPPLCS